MKTSKLLIVLLCLLLGILLITACESEDTAPPPTTEDGGTDALPPPDTDMPSTPDETPDDGSDGTDNGENNDDGNKEEPPAPVCQHAFTEYTVILEPTCTVEGRQSRSCTLCGRQEEHPIDALGHAHNASSVVFTWNDYTAVSVTVTCLHDKTHTEKLVATVTEAMRDHCSTAIYTARVRYDDVEYIDERMDILPMPRHTPVSIPAQLPTCTETGLSEGSVCKLCKDVLTKQEVLAATGHDFDRESPAWAWEGFAEASLTFVCKSDASHIVTLLAETTAAPSGRLCGELTYTARAVFEERTYVDQMTDTLTEPLHTAATDEAVAPTCTKDGLTEGSHCTACGDVLLAQEPIPALDHDYIGTEYEPTPQVPGYVHYACSRCSAQYDELTGKLHQHAYSQWKVEKAATCTEDGLRTRYCTDPACTETRSEALEAIGHQYIVLKWEWEDYTQAHLRLICINGCTEEHRLESELTAMPTGRLCGEFTYTARASFKGRTYVDQKTDTLTEPRHTIVIDKAVAPTCTKDGLTEGSHCAACGDVLLAQDTVSRMGHAYQAPVFTWNGYTAASALFVCANDDTHKETVIAAITSAPTGRLCGELCYTATVTFEEKTFREENRENLSAPRHTALTIQGTAPTCTEAGTSDLVYCEVCMETLIESHAIAPTGHSYTMEENRPLSHGDWFFLHTCRVCADTYTTESEDMGKFHLLSGGINAAGRDDANITAFHTAFFYGENVRVYLPHALCATVFYYSDTAFLSARLPDDNDSVYIAAYMPEGTTSFRVMIASRDGGAIPADLSEKVRFEKFGTVAEKTADAPEYQGVYNVLRRFAQMQKLTYYPLRDIPQKWKDLTANEKWVGLPYSSTRPEALFVPNNVSLYTFMTSLYNPFSYLYSVDLGEAPYNNVNGDTYYGAVCSTAAAYALNIVPNYSTHQWPEVPGMSVIDATDLRNLKLCDTIVGEGHVVMITGIDRTANGDVVTLYVSEASGDLVKRTAYTPDAFSKRYPLAKYTYCRYAYLADVPYTPSEFVAVGDEAPVNYVFDLPLVPRRGDKANHLVGTPIEIDVLTPDTYTEIRVYREGELIRSLPMTSYFALEGLTPGKYTACLADGERESKACSFLIVDVSSSAKAIGGGAVEVTFSSPSGAEALWVQWTGTTNGTVHITTLSPEQVAAGKAVCVYTRGTYKVRVAFRTEYGIVHSELPEAFYVR